MNIASVRWSHRLGEAVVSVSRQVEEPGYGDILVLDALSDAHIVLERLYDLCVVTSSIGEDIPVSRLAKLANDNSFIIEDSDWFARYVEIVNKRPAESFTEAQFHHITQVETP